MGEEAKMNEKVEGCECEVDYQGAEVEEDPGDEETS